ncbi:MAG TPA: FAD-binding oxidoreductase [Patescibacteria group bacterium]|nr:FAD-binding oxidoreductase [Patescibacteria group bacterium]
MNLPRPQKFVAEVFSKEFLDGAEKFLRISFKTENVVQLCAGQYFSFKINGKGERRSYSVSANDGNEFDIVVDISPEGIGSEFLKSLEIGQQVETLGPLGRFVTDENRRQPKLLFIATGSGIVPLKAMIDDLLLHKRDKREITLYWGLRTRADIFWLEEFNLLKKKFPNFNFQLCLSKPGETTDFLEGRVTQWIAGHFDVLKDHEAYVCGSNEMIADVKVLLKEKGMPLENFHEEQFF